MRFLVRREGAQVSCLGLQCQPQGHRHLGGQSPARPCPGEQAGAAGGLQANKLLQSLVGALGGSRWQELTAVRGTDKLTASEGRKLGPEAAGSTGLEAHPCQSRRGEETGVPGKMYLSFKRAKTALVSAAAAAAGDSFVPGLEQRAGVALSQEGSRGSARGNPRVASSCRGI